MAPTGPSEPGGFPQFPESFRGAAIFSVQSLSCWFSEDGPVQKRPLWELYVPGSLGSSLEPSTCFLVPGALACRAGYLQVSGDDALLCLLVAFLWSKRLQAVEFGPLYGDLAGRPTLLNNRAPTYAVNMEGNVNIGACSCGLESSHSSWRAPGFPAFSVLSFICCQKLFIQHLVVSQELLLPKIHVY